MDAIKQAKKVTLATLDRDAYRRYPLLVQAQIKGALVCLATEAEGDKWYGSDKATKNAIKAFERVYTDSRLEDDHKYVFRLAEEGLILIAIYDKDGKEDLGQLITLGAMGEFTTPKVYPANLTPEDAVAIAKADGAIGLFIHFYDGTYASLKV